MKLTHVIAGLAVFATAAFASDCAMAYWWHGSHGSSGGSSGGSWGSRGSHGRWGSRGSRGSSGGSSGWYSSGRSRGWYSSGGSSGGSSGWHSSGGKAIQKGATQKGSSAPSDAPDAPPAEAPARPAPDAAGVYVPADGVAISVRVPTGAKIFINDRATSSTGDERLYVSRGLRSGATYRYVVRAEVMQDGKKVDKEETVRLQPGQNANLEFNFTEEVAKTPESTDVSAKPVATTLLVNVPAKAKVFLSGAATDATGSSRQYVTHRLAEGQSWDNYLVRAEIERDGRKISRVPRVSIDGGETRQLNFDFDSPAVATR